LGGKPLRTEAHKKKLNSTTAVAREKTVDGTEVWVK